MGFQLNNLVYFPKMGTKNKKNINNNGDIIHVKQILYKDFNEKTTIIKNIY